MFLTHAVVRVSDLYAESDNINGPLVELVLSGSLPTLNKPEIELCVMMGRTVVAVVANGRLENRVNISPSLMAELEQRIAEYYFILKHTQIDYRTLWVTYENGMFVVSGTRPIDVIGLPATIRKGDPDIAFSLLEQPIRVLKAGEVTMLPPALYKQKPPVTAVPWVYSHSAVAGNDYNDKFDELRSPRNIPDYLSENKHELFISIKDRKKDTIYFDVLDKRDLSVKSSWSVPLDKNDISYDGLMSAIMLAVPGLRLHTDGKKATAYGDLISALESDSVSFSHSFCGLEAVDVQMDFVGDKREYTIVSTVGSGVTTIISVPRYQYIDIHPIAVMVSMSE